MNKEVRCPRCVFEADDLEELNHIPGTGWFKCPDCGYTDLYDGFIEDE